MRHPLAARALAGGASRSGSIVDSPGLRPGAGPHPSGAGPHPARRAPLSGQGLPHPCAFGAAHTLAPRRSPHPGAAFVGWPTPSASTSNTRACTGPPRTRPTGPRRAPAAFGGAGGRRQSRELVCGRGSAPPPAAGLASIRWRGDRAAPPTPPLAAPPQHPSLLRRPPRAGGMETPGARPGAGPVAPVGPAAACGLEAQPPPPAAARRRREAAPSFPNATSFSRCTGWLKR